LKEEKSEKLQKVFVGVSAAAVVVVVGILMYFLRASDPAARGPIPYKKFDYGAHMQEQTHEFNRQPSPVAGSAPGTHPTTP